VIEPHVAEETKRIRRWYDQIGVPLQQRQQIEGRCLPPIHFARLHGGGRGAGIRDHGPFNPIDVHDLGAGGETGRAVAPRHIRRIALIDRAGAGDVFIRLEAERSAAGHLGHLPERIGQGQSFRHHDADVGARLTKRRTQQRKWSFQTKPDRPVVRRGQLVGYCEHGLAKAVARTPAPNAGDAVLRKDFCAIMPQQAIAQGQVPGPAISLDSITGNHLR
jgi:hypothetical protein